MRLSLHNPTGWRQWSGTRAALLGLGRFRRELRRGLCRDVISARSTRPETRFLTQFIDNDNVRHCTGALVLLSVTLRELYLTPCSVWDPTRRRSWKAVSDVSSFPDIGNRRIAMSGNQSCCRRIPDVAVFLKPGVHRRRLLHPRWSLSSCSLGKTPPPAARIFVLGVLSRPVPTSHGHNRSLDPVQKVE